MKELCTELQSGNGIHTHVSTVTGAGEYEEKFVNIFSKPSFYVVPYNTNES